MPDPLPLERFTVLPVRARTPEEVVEAKDNLLGLMLETGSMAEAMQKADVSVRTLRRWRVDDPTFGREFEIALRDGTRMALEKVGIHRALNGGGSSDNLLMFFLKALSPEVYDDQVRRVNAGGKEGLTIEIVDLKPDAPPKEGDA